MYGRRTHLEIIIVHSNSGTLAVNQPVGRKIPICPFYPQTERNSHSWLTTNGSSGQQKENTFNFYFLFFCNLYLSVMVAIILRKFFPIILSVKTYFLLMKTHSHAFYVSKVYHTFEISHSFIVMIWWCLEVQNNFL